MFALLFNYNFMPGDAQLGKAIDKANQEAAEFAKYKQNLSKLDLEHLGIVYDSAKEQYDRVDEQIKAAEGNAGTGEEEQKRYNALLKEKMHLQAALAAIEVEKKRKS
jgi:uncharacterized protein YdcH (DUF465 family)